MGYPLRPTSFVWFQNCSDISISIVGRGLLTPVLWRPSSILPTANPTFSKFCPPPPCPPPPPPPTHTHTTFTCITLFVDGSTHVKPLYNSIRRTLLCVLCNKKFTEVWHKIWFFAGTLIWYYTHKHTQHTQRPDTPI